MEAFWQFQIDHILTYQPERKIALLDIICAKSKGLLCAHSKPAFRGRIDQDRQRVTTGTPPRRTDETCHLLEHKGINYLPNFVA